MKININIGGKILTATLADNATAQDFASVLPLNVSMNDLFGREKYGDVPKVLSENGPRKSKYEVGDIAYWSPDHQFAVYYHQDGEAIPSPGIIPIANDAERTTVETTLEDWDSLHNINARGTFIGCREVIPLMKAAGGGSIINVSSTFAIVGRAGFAAYAASKGAVRAMTKALAAELAEFNIRVNSIYPGTIETNLTKHVLSSPAAIEQIIGPQLIRRPGLPAEVASVVLFLASDESSFVTGAEMVVDGGYTSV